MHTETTPDRDDCIRPTFQYYNAHVWNMHEHVIDVLYYSDVMMSAMASKIIGVSIVCSTICSSADLRTQQSSVSLAFMRWPVDSPHKEQVTRKMFPSDDVIKALSWLMLLLYCIVPWGEVACRCDGYIVVRSSQWQLFSVFSVYT